MAAEYLQVKTELAELRNYKVKSVQLSLNQHPSQNTFFYCDSNMVVMEKGVGGREGGRMNQPGQKLNILF